VQGFDPEVHRFRLVSRRLKGHLNSLGAEVPGTHRAASTNYAYMHPDDLADLGVDDEGLVRISSPRASLVGVAKAAPDVRRGVVSMAHGWGDTSGSDDKVRDVGAPTNRLIDVDNGYCRITGQAIQSSIPVAVEAVVLEGAAAN